MAKGIVKWCSQRIGAGFIKSEEGQDIFFRLSTISSEGPKILRQGQQVSFDLRKNRHSLSLSAANVRVFELS